MRSRHYAMLSACLGMSLLAMSARPAMSADITVEQAIAQSKQTGKPILAVFGTETWGPCVALAQRMQSASLKPLVTQYVYIHIDLNKQKDESSKWYQLFPNKVASISMPMVQIVASDGTRHFNNQEERKSIDKQLLTHYLSLSRRQLSEKEVAQVKKAHEEAKTLLEAGDEASAIEKLKPAVAMRGLGDEAAQVDALVAELIEKARSSMNEAHQQLQSETDAVRGAVELLRVHRIYGEVPELKAEILELAAKVRSEKSLKKPFNLARMIDRADKLPRKTASQRERAIKTYQSIARNHEKNQAGEIATERIAALGAIAERPEATEPEAGEPDEPATASQDGKTPVKPAVAKKAEKTQEQKDAELYFRIARTSARTDRQKAREYAEKVIELVPDSKLAESARKLLEQL